MQLRTRTILYFSALFLSACASVSELPTSAATGIDGQACVGAAPAALDGLSPTSNAPLQAKAQYASGKGGVCSARTYTVAAPLQVYRVYDAEKPWSAYGGWWALSRPGGTRDEYRAQNAICAEWSPLDRLIACQLKVGAEIVLGTTQSVACADGSVYPKTAAVQAFLPNDQRNGVLHVENCREEGRWP